MKGAGAVAIRAAQAFADGGEVVAERGPETDARFGDGELLGGVGDAAFEVHGAIAPLRVDQAAAKRQGFGFLAPPLAYCTENAAMIALAGAERLAAGLFSGLDAPARPRWPLDEASALSRPTHKPGRKGAKA